MIDIVIVNWNSGTLLSDCIHSIVSNDNLSTVQQIIIVDNNSADGSTEAVLSHEKIIVIRNKRNEGFAKAANQGFRICTSELVLLLNPDTCLYNSTLPDSLNFMRENPQVDVLGCQLINSAAKIAPSCSRFPTSFSFLFEALGFTKLVPQIFKPVPIMVDWDHKTSRYVDQVMGAFMLIRKSVFSKIGYLDEDFFVYYEDLDFSIRLQESGGKSFFNASIKAIHSGAGTTAKVKDYRLALLLRSKTIYARKHFSKAGLMLTKITIYLVEPWTRILYFTLSGNIRELKETFKGYKLFFKGSNL